MTKWFLPLSIALFCAYGWFFPAAMAGAPRLWPGMLLSRSPRPLPAPWRGRVVRILDGDTLEVLRQKQAVRIRLYGIDCPEKRQPYGTRAKQFTADLAFGKDVTVQERSRDRYERAVAEILLPDGHSLNRELVRAGLAWWYRKYAPHESGLAELEEQARDQRRGLWADDDPTPPWLWRHARR